ncbi:MAG: tandem-95 repeat protein [Chloroflexi bacterium]|nr:tandem-95 repeat protein [Chloroflexota bacterium]
MMQDKIQRAYFCSKLTIVCIMVVGFTVFGPITPALAGDGPGGIGEIDGASNLNLWLKADVGVYQDLGCSNVASNGGAAACWIDQSGYGNHVTRGSDGSPSYQTDVVNGQPVLRFVEQYMMAADIATWRFFHDGSDHSVFIVWQTASSDPQDQYYLMGTAHTSRHSGFAFGYSDTGMTEDQIEHRIMKGTPGSYLLSHSANDVFPTGTFGIAAFRFDDGAAGGDDVIFVNGAPVSSANANATPSSAYPTATLGIGSDGAGHHPLTGDIAEVIVYISTLSPVDRTHVDLYLMDKYDIDLSGTGLYASTYNLNVRGISTSADVTDSGSSAGLTITNIDFLADTDDVLVFGHDSADNVGTLADIPLGFGARWSRVWYIVENDVGNNGGNVRLTFDLGEVGDTAYDGNTYHLLTRDGTSGDFGSVRTTTTVVGDQVIFDNVDVSLLGPYFTLGRPPVVVTITDDEYSPNSNCSLREAIQAANIDAAYGDCKAGNGADTIVLSGNTYALTRAGAGENENRTGDLDIADTLAIVGAGSGLTTIDGNALDRVFDIRPGVDTVIISGTAISDGSVTGNGGGISNDDTNLTLINTVVDDNSANSGGGVYVGSGNVLLNDSEIQGNAATYGGGLYITLGSATLNGGQIQNNSANTNGGGVYVDQANASLIQDDDSVIALNSASSGGGIYVMSGSVTLETGQILSNTTTSGNGGGMYVNAGNVAVNDGEIRGNDATSNGGGVYVFEGAVMLRGGEIINNTATAGGGVYVSRSDGSFIQNQDVGPSVIAYNTANFVGGGVYVEFGSVIVSAGQILGNDAAFYGGGVYVEEGRGVWIGGQVTGNTAGDDGGGMYNTGTMMLNNVHVFDNASGPTDDDGGGIYNRGSMALNDVQVYGNAATMYGGGIYNYGDGVLAMDNSTVNNNTSGNGGGGLYSADATLALTATQILDNHSDLNGGGLYMFNSDAALTGNTISGNTASQDGGGLYLNASDDLLTNNIIANNEASGQGSALYSYSSANPQLLHNTIVENTGSTGVYVNGSGTTTLINNILAGHTTAVQVESGSASLQATLWDGNITDSSGANATHSDDRYGTPAFEDAANDDYHLIPWLSAATDTGINAGVTDDFDGNARPQGAGFDIGAFEGPETGLAIVKTVNANLVVPGQSIVFTLVYTNHGPGVADGVFITDLIDSSVVSFSYTSTGATITPVGSEDYVWSVQDLDPGEGGTITIDGKVAMGLLAGHTFVNRATITTTTPTESVPENNTDEVEIAVSLLANTTDDELNSDGDCSLREAIQAANTDSAVDACAAGDGDDIIYLSADTYALTLPGAGEDSNTTGDLDVTDALTIMGINSGQTIIDADSIADRVFDIRPGAGTVIVSGTTIINGNVTGCGGGIYDSDADLDLVNVVIRDNTATDGGGVCVGSGSATLSVGQIQNNSATNGGGVYVAQIGGSFVQTSDGTITQNTATNGGGIYVNLGNATASGGQIISNTATNGGGLYVAGGDAVLSGGQVVDNSAADGGGLYVAGGNVTLNGSQIRDNSVTGNGSSIYIANGTIAHATPMTLVGDIYQSNGAFSGGSALLVLQGSLYLEGGTFTAPTGELSITGNLIHNAGTFAHNNGTVALNGSSAQSILGTNTFYNLTINNSSATDEVDASSSTLTVDNLLHIQDGTFQGSSDYHHVQIDSGATLELDTAITVSGDWTNHGTFTPNGHTVDLDGENQTIAGDTTFYNLDKMTNSPATLTFAAGNTFAIVNRLDLRGAGSSARISLRSSASGTYWNIDPQGTRIIAYLNVMDSRNVNTTVIAAHATNSVDSGNNPGWNFHYPVANDVDLFTDEDTTITGTLDATDADTDDSIRYAILTYPVSGTLTFTDMATGDLIYTPTNQTAAYVDICTYVVTDTGGLTDVATVRISVDADNDPPIANDDGGAGYVTDENTPIITGNVLDNDTDIDNPTLAVDSFDTSSTAGLVTNNGDGTFDYDPNGQFEYLAAGEQTIDTFTYVVSDGNSTDVATVTLTIHGVNDPPTALDDNYAITEDDFFTTSNVLDNDIDLDTSDILSLVGFDTSATIGLVSYNGDGTFDYDPNEQFEYLTVGEQVSDTFTYVISDDTVTDTATVNITVSGVNDAPIADGDIYLVAFNTPLIVLPTRGVLVNDIDIDGDVLTATQDSTPTGTLSFNPDGSFVYTPTTDSRILDVFTYHASDPYTDSNIVTVVLYVLDETDADLGVSKSVNSPLPNEGDIVIYTLQVTNEGLTDTTGVVVSDTLPPGVSHWADGGDGNYDETTGVWTIGTLNDGDVATLYITATVDGGTMGDTITNTAVISASVQNDPVLVNDAASVSLSVNVSPVASGDSYTTDEESAIVTGNVLDNDTDLETPHPLLSVVDYDTGDTIGLVINIGGGVFGYDPNGQFEYLAVGEQTTDTFTYVLADAGGLTDTATVTITIIGVNDPPIANDDGGPEYTTDEDTPFTTANVLDNDTDLDVTDSLFATLSSSPPGLVTDNGDGTFAIDPNGQYEQLALGEQAVFSCTYVVSDGVLTDTATVTITINGANDAPTANDDNYSTDEDISLVTGNVLDNDTDPDDSDTLSWVSFDAIGVTGLITATGDGVFEYDPNGQFESLAVGQQAFETFTYVASDSILTDTAAVTITISGANDPPQAAGENYSAIYETPLHIPAATGVLTNDFDIDGDSLTATLAISPTGALNFASDGSFVYTPTSNFRGPDTFTYYASDSYTDSNVVTVTIYVYLPTEANLEVSKDVNDATPKEGDTIVYTLWVTNNGITDTTGVIISDTLPVGVQYVTSGGDGEYEENSGNWTVGALDNGDSAVHYITATVDIGTTGITITNVAAVSVSDRNDPISNNDADSATIVPIPPTDSDLEMSKAVDDPTPTTGETFIYTLQVTNHGPAGTMGIVVSDTLPSGTSYVADDGNGDYDANTGTWTVGTLLYSEIVTLHITATMDAPTPGTIITNTAVISASDRYDHIPGNEVARVAVTVNSRPTANDDGGAEYTTGEDSLFPTGNVLGNDTDPDALDILFVADVDTSGTLGLVTDNGDGTFDYDPNGQFEFLAAGEQITDTFIYTVSDDPLTDTATVTVIITGVNDAPTISEISSQSADADTVVGPIPFTIGDVDTLVETLTLESASSNMALVPTTTIIFGGSGVDRTITITPTAGMEGITTITIAVSDGEHTAYEAFELMVVERRIYLPLVVTNN